MRVLVTGSQGTLGKKLVATLETENAVWGTDRAKIKAPRYFPGDITRYETLDPVFDEAKPDVVYHLAGEVSREICDHWPTIAAESNVVGTMNVALLCLRYGARLVYAGSSEEYGDAFDKGPVSEGTPLGKPRGVYALTKRMAEDVIEHWHRMRGLDAILLRLFMCYGCEHPTPYRSAIAQFIYQARMGQDLIVHRATERSWCHIDDMIDGIRRAGEFKLKDGQARCEVFLLGRNEATATEEIAKTIIQTLNSQSKIRLVDPPTDVTPVKRATFEKAAKLLGWKAETSIEAGLRKEIEWQKENVPLPVTQGGKHAWADST
jgi:nucleoside-diphosphate-sugar epimerase